MNQEEELLQLVKDCPFINGYRVMKNLNWNTGKTYRCINRLVEDGKLVKLKNYINNRLVYFLDVV